MQQSERTPEIVDGVDLSDVKQFSDYAHHWWDPKGETKPLHCMNPIRASFMRDGLFSPGIPRELAPVGDRELEGYKILDVGCGGGILAEALARTGAEVVGVDPGEVLIKVAEEHLSSQKSLKARNNLTYKAQLIQDHAKECPEKYDAVVASDVLEHVPDKELFLESCVKALKPGGSLFITTLNKTWTSWFFGIIWAEFILRLIPMHTHIWSQFISPESVAKILKRFGCETLLVRGVEYQFYLFPGRFRYQGSQRIQYMLHAVKAGDKLKKTKSS